MNRKLSIRVASFATFAQYLSAVGLNPQVLPHVDLEAVVQGSELLSHDDLITVCEALGLGKEEMKHAVLLVASEAARRGNWQWGTIGQHERESNKRARAA